MADDEHLLDFEKPLVELEDKLAEMRDLNEETQDDLSNEIKALEDRVERLRTSIYRNLTRWQRVQIAVDGGSQPLDPALQRLNLVGKVVLRLLVEVPHLRELVFELDEGLLEVE